MLDCEARGAGVDTAELGLWVQAWWPEFDPWKPVWKERTDTKIYPDSTSAWVGDGGTQVHAHMHIYMHKEGERKIKIMEK